MILTTAVGYEPQVSRMFLNSLRMVGYKEQIVILTDDLKRGFDYVNDLNIVPVQFTGPKHLPLNSRRFLCFVEYIAKNGIPDQVIVSDIRDVVFQRNPTEHLSKVGVHAYCEYEGMTIGKCPYNSKWIKEAYGKETLSELSDFNIICAGLINGCGSSVYGYMKLMVEELLKLPPTAGFDQGVHNYLTYIKQMNIVHANEYGPVYTVGYMPRESLQLSEDKLFNKWGIPCVVHQYDRHKNLTEAFKGIYNDR